MYPSFDTVQAESKPPGVFRLYYLCLNVLKQQPGFKHHENIAEIHDSLVRALSAADSLDAAQKALTPSPEPKELPKPKKTFFGPKRSSPIDVPDWDVDDKGGSC
jgi:hypothetical protein